MISIIIPTLNEEENISSLLEYLLKNSSETFTKEIIVVDGGSSDNTIKKVKLFPRPVQLITASKGRAIQMNSAAKIASGTILYFLHADSLPPKDFDKYIVEEVEKGNPAGCFYLKFKSNHWWLKLAGWFTKLNWKMCRGGDQSLFITQPLFNQLGGYNEDYIIYEDQILINQLYKKNLFTVINKPILTSARLYEKKGVWTLQYYFWMIYLKKKLGATPQQLYNYYKKNIAG